MFRRALELSAIWMPVRMHHLVAVCDGIAQGVANHRFGSGHCPQEELALTGTALVHEYFDQE